MRVGKKQNIFYFSSYTYVQSLKSGVGLDLYNLACSDMGPSQLIIFYRNDAYFHRIW